MSNISLKKIKEIIEKENKKPTKDDFIMIHSICEVYFRRLLYIAIRLDGVKDIDAKLISSKCTLSSDKILSKAMRWLFKIYGIDISEDKDENKNKSKEIIYLEKLSKKEKINCSTNDFCTSYTQDIDLFGLFYFCNFT
jgi:hypothetical protein